LHRSTQLQIERAFAVQCSLKQTVRAFTPHRSFAMRGSGVAEIQNATDNPTPQIPLFSKVKSHTSNGQGWHFVCVYQTELLSHLAPHFAPAVMMQRGPLAQLHAAHSVSFDSDKSYVLDICAPRSYWSSPSCHQDGHVASTSNMCAVSASNGLIKVYDAATLHMKAQMKHEKSMSTGITFFNDSQEDGSTSQVMLSSGKDGVVLIWDLRVGGQFKEPVLQMTGRWTKGSFEMRR
jgi:WD40 repeat protein